MKIATLLRASLFLVVLAICSRDAAAQVKRYQPSRAPLSPYLNLLRPEGALPNYYALVRPLEEQRQFERNTRGFERRQNLLNRDLEQQMGQPSGIIATGTAGRFMSDGKSGAYLNSRPYFNQFQSQRMNTNRRR
jgi:hypothetical protein